MRNRQAREWATILVALAFVAAFVAAPALAEEKYEEKFAKTESLAKTGKVYLSNISGDMTSPSGKRPRSRSKPSRPPRRRASRRPRRTRPR